MGIRLGGKLLAPLLGAAALIAAPPADAARPNVVLVVTDDQTLESFQRSVMPKTTRHLADRGTTFTEAIVATPQCCPSRAQVLTGQYPHNNGVPSNRPGYSTLRAKRNVLPAWLAAAGYRTIHIGKFLHRYSHVGGLDPAPGWDRWLTLVKDRYLTPIWSIDGRRREDSGRYVTNSIARMGARIVRRESRRAGPFYLQVDHFAPHPEPRHRSGRCRGAAVPAGRDGGSFAGSEAPRSPASSESDLSDKPPFISERRPLSGAKRAEVNRHYGCALASLRAVDRAIRRLVRALRRSGELGRTMIVFTSDNGSSFGEHRIPLGKGLAYEENLRVPLVIRPPRDLARGGRGRRSEAPVANLDLAPTILALGGAEPCRRGRCRRLDGRSLLPLLRGRTPRWAARRAIGTSFDVNQPRFGKSCRWAGFRTPTLSVISHERMPDPETKRCASAAFVERYDLSADPFQLEAVGSLSSAEAARLAALGRCSGVAGRDRRLPNRPFCE